MFSYSCVKNEFHTYTLWNEDKSTCMKIVPERGGIVNQFKVNNQDILYRDDESVYDHKAIIRAGIPILFPICGNLDNDTYNVEGRKYSIKNHGFSRDFPWKVEDIWIKEQEASIVISQESNQDTLKVFPFKYKLIYKYTLKSDALEIEATFINSDNVSFDFYAGFHPYFYIPDKEKVNLSILSESVVDTLGDGYIDNSLNF
ncbi:MAG: hypothetical protein VB130_08715, partial [Clostridium sp.]|nr:hypothetical protein [Clostridium sp.]